MTTDDTPKYKAIRWPNRTGGTKWHLYDTSDKLQFTLCNRLSMPNNVGQTGSADLVECPTCKKRSKVAEDIQP